MRGVYLLHFDEPYRHAQHYLGYSDDIVRRVDKHLAGRSMQPLILAVLRAEIGISLVRVWPDAERGQERRLKNRSSSRLCPLCHAGKGFAWLEGTMLPSLYGDDLRGFHKAVLVEHSHNACRPRPKLLR
jgi:hypothetical protein